VRFFLGKKGNTVSPQELSILEEELRKSERLCEEREFAEDLVCRRLHFLLIFFAAVVVGVVQVRVSPILTLMVLAVGAVVSVLLALALFRVHAKMSLLFDALPEKYAANVVHRLCNAKYKGDFLGRGCSRRRLIGYVIPVICCATLVIGAFCTVLSLLMPTCLPWPFKMTI
jgi:membrane associated rhomboid family serine protease